MTKKDYIIIADALKEGWKEARTKIDPENQMIVPIIKNLGIAFRNENPKFSATKFEERIFGKGIYLHENY